MSELATGEVRQNLIGDALRRRWWIPVVFALLAALGGWALASSRTATYTSSVEVLVRPLVGNPLAPDTGVSTQQVTSAMATEAQVVDSEAVADLAAPSLSEPWVPGSGTVKSEVPSNSQIVDITFQAESADDAQAGAQATAEAFLDNRAVVAKQAQSQRIDILKNQAASARESLERAVKASASDKAGPEAAQQVQLVANQLVTIRTTMSTLRATGGNPGTVVAPASLPESPGGPPAYLLALAAGLLGLLLGAGVAIWRERRDTRVRLSHRAVAGVPVLTAMAAGGGFRSRRRRAEAASAAQLIERLRTFTLVAAPAPDVVALGAVRPGTHVVPVAVDLAASLAEAGYRVSLVVADPSEKLPIDLDRQGDTGLATALGTQASVHDYLVPVQGFQVLPAGRDLSAATPLLSSPRLRELLDELQATSDYVVVAAPPAATAIGSAVAVAATSLILVGTDRTTTREEVETARVGVEQLNVRLLGIALVARGAAERPHLYPPAPDGAQQHTSRPLPEEDGEAADTPTGSPVPQAKGRR